jgi:enterochelin esterase-like enzyme
MMTDKKQIGSNTTGAAERFRLILSDGVHWAQAMLATQLNDLVKNDQIQVHTVLRLQEFIVNNVQNRKYEPDAPMRLNRIAGLYLLLRLNRFPKQSKAYFRVPV